MEAANVRLSEDSDYVDGWRKVPKFALTWQCPCGVIVVDDSLKGTMANGSESLSMTGCAVNDLFPLLVVLVQVSIAACARHRLELLDQGVDAGEDGCQVAM